MSTGIGSPLALGGLYPSVDGRYVAANGKPFTSVSNAESALNGFPSKLSESCVGYTVLVKESGWTEAKEYWVQPKGTTPETYGLVEKGAGTTDYNDLENKPTIGDGTNTALPIVGNVKVSATTASGSTAGVTVTPGQNTGEIEMQFTLPKGDKGEDGADGQDGAPGNDAVNPFKGYYPSGVSLPATGAVGDYLYAPPSDSQSTATATIWHYDSTQTPPWTDTEIDVSAVVGVEFGSGQSVSATKIKDETGEEVQGTADVLSAEAGKRILIAKGVYPGYLKPSNGTIQAPNSTTHLVSEFIPFKSDLYFHSIEIGTTTGLCFFDEFANYYGKYTSATTGKQDVTLSKSDYPNVSFVRFTTKVANDGYCTLTSLDGILDSIEHLSSIITSVYGDFFTVADSLLKSNGTIIESANKFCTDYIPIDASKKIILYAYVYNGNTYAPVCFYDVNRSFLGYKTVSVTSSGNTLIEVATSDMPEGTKYIRCCSEYRNGFIIANLLEATNERLIELITQVNGISSSVTANTTAVQTIMTDNYEDGLGEEQTMTIAGAASYASVEFSTVDVDYLPAGTRIVSAVTESGSPVLYFHVANDGNYPTGGMELNIRTNAPLTLSETCYGIKSSAVANYTIKYRLPIKVSKVDRLDAAVSNLEQSAPPLGKLAVEKIANEINLYINKAGDLYYKIPIRHAVKEYDAALAESYYDVWGVKVSSLVRFNNGVFEQVYDITTSGEQEVAINTEYGNGTTGSVFVGGSTHGFDNIMTEDSIRCFSLVVDGKNIGESDLLELAPIKDFVLLQKEELCKAKSTTPVAHVEKRYSISENEIGLKLNVKFTPLDDTTHWGQGYFGMFCIKRSAGNNKYISSRLVKDNHPFLIYNVEDEWWNEDYADDLKNYDVNCREIREYTPDYNTAYALKVTKPVSLNASIDYASMFMAYNTASSNYNKIYNMVNRGTPTLDPTRTYEGELVFVYM